MRFKQLFHWTGIFLATMVLLWGCESSHPIQPAQNMTLAVTVPVDSGLKASLLGVTSNEVLYDVRAGKAIVAKGTIGPFSSSSLAGALDFSINVSTQASNVILSLQLNDASNHKPLAIGAASLSLSTPGSQNVSMELGSVNRNCYVVSGPASLYDTGETYDFDQDNLFQYQSYSYGFDIAAGNSNDYNGFQFVDAQENTAGAVYANSIAYMGNGDLVDFDYVPDTSDFAYTSSDSKSYQTGLVIPPNAGAVRGKAVATTTDLEAGDIYCIALGSIPGGHAWVQVVNPGQYGYTSPIFIFRINRTLPYYAYDRTTADISNNCSSVW